MAAKGRIYNHESVWFQCGRIEMICAMIFGKRHVHEDEDCRIVIYVWRGTAYVRHWRYLAADTTEKGE